MFFDHEVEGGDVETLSVGDLLHVTFTDPKQKNIAVFLGYYDRSRLVKEFAFLIDGCIMFLNIYQLLKIERIGSLS